MEVWLPCPACPALVEVTTRWGILPDSRPLITEACRENAWLQGVGGQRLALVILHVYCMTRADLWRPLWLRDGDELSEAGQELDEAQTDMEGPLHGFVGQPTTAPRPLPDWKGAMA